MEDGSVGIDVGTYVGIDGSTVGTAVNSYVGINDGTFVGMAVG